MNLLQKDTHELSKLVDDIGITHIRMQQTVKGYPVGEVIILFTFQKMEIKIKTCQL